jgi:hypothetical protein
MGLKVVNTNRLRDFHCRSQTQALMRVQPHKSFLETIKLEMQSTIIATNCAATLYRILSSLNELDNIQLVIINTYFNLLKK